MSSPPKRPLSLGGLLGEEAAEAVAADEGGTEPTLARTEPSFDAQEPSLPTTAQDPLIGTVLGVWRLIRVLGSGASARVYEARHVLLERVAALKILRGDLAASTAGRARMVREARVLARLEHPNIIRLFDFGFAQGGLPFIVMERLEGRDLSTILAAEAPLDHERLVRIFGQVASGLAVAHEAGLMHRDLKPANVFITGSGPSEMVKLLDFGLAAAVDADELGGPLTRVNQIVGTPMYMAPEQARAEKATPAADVYSLGAILYELISGKPPFAGSLQSVLQLKGSQTPEPLPPGPMSELAMKLLARSSASRPQNGPAVVELLRAAVGQTDDATADWSPTTNLARSRPSDPAPRRAGLERLTLVLTLAGAGISLGAAVMSRRPVEPAGVPDRDTLRSELIELRGRTPPEGDEAEILCQVSTVVDSTVTPSRRALADAAARLSALENELTND